jgi:hypothetical protein
MRALRLLLRRRRGQFRQAVLCAMVPLAFLNGWPVVGCICADGSYSSTCSMLRESTTESASESCCCKVACCTTSETDAPKPSCCQATADYPADRKESHAGGEPGCRITHKGCCHTVVQAGELPTLSRPVQVSDHDQSLAPLIAFAWEGVNRSLPPRLASFVDDDTGQCPSDLVITLRRLVI